MLCCDTVRGLHLFAPDSVCITKTGSFVTISSSVDNLQRAIALETHASVAAWNNAPERVPGGLERFTLRQQQDNERQVEMLLERGREESSGRRMATPGNRLLLAKRARFAITKHLLRFDDPAVNALMEDCESAAESFARTAKDFDPALPAADILQALRNQWVFNSIQRYLGHPVSVTPSSFAYSMLYPYTDNSIDSAGSSEPETDAFLAWLALRLRGVNAEMQGNLSRTVGRLLGMIELHYPRSGFPDVYASLLAIHTAQEKSLSLCRVQPSVDEDLLLAISVEKGGTSVLADGYLVTGTLTAPHMDVMFAYGVILQLIDDLQDLEEDRAAGCSTPFTRALDRHDLRAATNRLFAYLGWCLALMREHAPGDAGYLCELIRRSCSLLILEAIARHREWYDTEYIGIMQKHMPLPVDYFGSMHERADTGSSTFEQVFEKVTRQFPQDYDKSGEPHYAA
jgi:hypothetical protein